jgi:hypothetical protein
MLDQQHFGLLAVSLRSGKKQQISIRIFDDKILRAPRLLLQFLEKRNTSGLKVKKQ